MELLKIHEYLCDRTRLRILNLPAAETDSLYALHPILLTAGTPG